VVREAAAPRLARLGTPRDRIRVVGDPRFDSVLQVLQRVSADEPLLRFGRGAPTLVAGSTWPEDESVLLEAFARIHLSRPDARLFIVPHEPTPAHLARVDAIAARLGLPRPVRLSDATEPVPLLLVDRTGVLARLYGAGTMAYVGGGFGSAGLHSVLEPAAWSIPVIVGPRWQESRDAELLLEAGAAEAVAELGEGEPDESLRRIWEAWLSDEPRRLAQGQRARRVVESGAGAAEASAAMLAALLPAAAPIRERPAPRS
jgi:3-deoxy-D-manno-octulosonic-acid transferase